MELPHAHPVHSNEFTDNNYLCDLSAASHHFSLVTIGDATTIHTCKKKLFPEVAASEETALLLQQHKK